MREELKRLFNSHSVRLVKPGGYDPVWIRTDKEGLLHFAEANKRKFYYPICRFLESVCKGWEATIFHNAGVDKSTLKEEWWFYENDKWDEREYLKGLPIKLCAHAYHGRVKEARKLINKGIFPDHNSYGTTPLCCAAINGNIEIAKMLLKAGADINWRSKIYTPLISALRVKNWDMARFLLKKGALYYWPSKNQIYPSTLVKDKKLNWEFHCLSEARNNV